MTFSFHPAALAEFEEAARHYAGCQPGLDQRFEEAVETAIRRAIDFPLRGTKIDDDVRRVRTPVFPYALIYQPTKDHVRFIAVMHSRRKPGYWRNRVVPAG